MLNFNTGRTLVGINEDDIQNTVNKIYNIADELNTKFKDVENVMYNIEDSISCSGVSNMKEKFNTLKASFDNIVANVNTYADDLLKVRTKFENIDDNAVTMISFNTK